MILVITKDPELFEHLLLLGENYKVLISDKIENVIEFVKVLEEKKELL